MPNKPITLSGVQPSGNIHIGNYFGSIENWINLQENNFPLFGIMDLHAITANYDPKTLEENILNLAITYIGAGVDPKKSIIFIQSNISEHLELAWILGCNTPIGWLNRMTQFKDKSQGEKNKENAKHGLYYYPILMAADILLYKTKFVPIGNDQKQHLELATQICKSFNQKYKTDILQIPQYIYTESQRIMSLTDATNKMSKSDINDNSRINLSDSKDLIIKKIKKAKTDSTAGISYDATRFELTNLLRIFSCCIDKSPQEIAKDYQDKNFAIFKNDLAEAIVEKLSPIQDKISYLKKDLTYIRNILDEGNSLAKEIASKNITEIKKIVGFIG